VDVYGQALEIIPSTLHGFAWKVGLKLLKMSQTFATFCAKLPRTRPQMWADVGVKWVLFRMGDSESPYMQGMIGKWARRLTPEEQLSGSGMTSIETCEDFEDTSEFVYVQENFAAFLHHLRSLNPRQQEMLLTYYCLGKSQGEMAKIFTSTQTVMSFQLRVAFQTLCCFMMFGGKPSRDQMKSIFEKAGLEDMMLAEAHRNSVPGDRIPAHLSSMVEEYAKSLSYNYVAVQHGLHRPDVRRAFSKAYKQLRDSQVPKQRALGAYLFSLVDKMSASGAGITKREVRKYAHHHGADPDVLGKFVVKIGEPGFGALFTPRANR
jgi:hypothetical protein